MSKCITISPVLSVLNTHLLFANPLNLWEKKLTTIKTGIYKDQQPTLNYGHFVSVLSVSFYFMLVIFKKIFKANRGHSYCGQLCSPVPDCLFELSTGTTRLPSLCMTGELSFRIFFFFLPPNLALPLPLQNYFSSVKSLYTE